MTLLGPTDEEALAPPDLDNLVVVCMPCYPSLGFNGVFVAGNLSVEVSLGVWPHVSERSLKDLSPQTGLKPCRSLLTMTWQKTGCELERMTRKGDWQQ